MLVFLVSLFVSLVSLPVFLVSLFAFCVSLPVSLVLLPVSLVSVPVCLFLKVPNYYDNHFVSNVSHIEQDLISFNEILSDQSLNTVHNNTYYISSSNRLHCKQI